MSHPLVKKRYPRMTTQNEVESSLGNCCLCNAPLVRVDYQWWYRADRYRATIGGNGWQTSHETNLAHDGACHCADCESVLKDTRNRFVKRQRVNYVERDGTVSTELVTRAPLHPNWNNYFRSIGMQPVK